MVITINNLKNYFNNRDINLEEKFEKDYDGKIKHLKDKFQKINNLQP